MTPPASEADLAEWVALARAPRIGPVTFFQLLDRFGTPGDALAGMPSINADMDAARREIDDVRQAGATILTAADPRFPKALSHLSPPPPLITAIGKLDLLNRPAIALVGARDASAAGRKIARQLSTAVGQAGLEQDLGDFAFDGVLEEAGGGLRGRIEDVQVDDDRLRFEAGDQPAGRQASLPPCWHACGHLLVPRTVLAR